MTVDYMNAIIILCSLLACALVLSVFLKKAQKKFQKQGELCIKESIMIDPKRRIMIINVGDKRYLYGVGPHNDTLLSLGQEQEKLNTIRSDVGRTLSVSTPHGAAGIADPKLSIPSLKLVSEGESHAP